MGAARSAEAFRSAALRQQKFGESATPSLFSQRGEERWGTAESSLPALPAGDEPQPGR